MTMTMTMMLMMMMMMITEIKNKYQFAARFCYGPDGDPVADFVACHSSPITGIITPLSLAAAPPHSRIICGVGGGGGGGGGDDSDEVIVFCAHVQVDSEGGRDKQRRCMQVNLIKSSNLEHEREFLFAPYSVFTVRVSTMAPQHSPTTRVCTQETRARHH